MIPWNKWKWEYNNPKSMGQRERSPKREIHSITSLLQETRKISDKRSNLTLKGIRKRTKNKNWSESKKENNKV